MKRDFVVFLSPGTFFSEETVKPISAWNVEEATQMADGIVERYNATPFAFYFITRERGDDELDSKETARSGRYFLGGRIETLAEIKARNDPEESILILNMEGNGWGKIVVNDNSFRSVQPFTEQDVLLEYKPPVRVEVAS